ARRGASRGARGSQRPRPAAARRCVRCWSSSNAASARCGGEGGTGGGRVVSGTGPIVAGGGAHGAPGPAVPDPAAATASGPRLRIALCAGEASGDLLGAGLVAELAARFPEARFAGVGGVAMRAAGVDT